MGRPVPTPPTPTNRSRTVVSALAKLSRQPLSGSRAWRSLLCSTRACCSRRIFETRCCGWQVELFVPVWSAHVIGELERNLVEYRVARTAVARLTALMSDTFPDASVIAYEDLIPSMTCHEKDRHVLAAAVRSGAAAVVTFNLRDSPPRAPSRTRSTWSILPISSSTCSILLRVRLSMNWPGRTRSRSQVSRDSSPKSGGVDSG